VETLCKGSEKYQPEYTKKLKRCYNKLMNNTVDTLTPEQRAEVERAVKLTVKKYRKTLIKLAST
jgi:hypothetical protein